MTCMNELLELLAFHTWASRKTFETLNELSSEQLHRDLGSSFKSIFETLVHSFGADRAWLGRLEGDTPTKPNPADFPSLEALLSKWNAVLDRLPLAVEQMGNPELEIHYKTYNGEPNTNSLGQIVRHVVNHGTYHRGQVVAMQRMMGVKAASTDLILFYRLKK